MRARASVGALAVVVATTASAAGLATMTTGVASAADGPVAHFVVLAPEGAPVEPTAASVQQAGGTVIQSWPQIGVLIATSPSADFAKTVRTLPGVAAAGASRDLAEIGQGSGSSGGSAKLDEPITAAKPAAARLTAAAVTPEPLEANQWDLRMIKGDQASAVSQGSRDVLVGVLDSGIEATHPDLAANIDAADSVGCTNEGVPDTSPSAWAPTTSTHGTHVAGTIAATRNGIGIAGIAPDVRLASVKVVDDDGFIYPEYAICGFVWAAEHGMDVTNNSYFIDPWYYWCADDPDQGAVLDAVSRAVDYSARHDVVNVAALGNENRDLSHSIFDTGSPDNGATIERTAGNQCLDLPAEIPGVVGVSAVGPEQRKSFYSNYGISETDVTAPGGDSRQTASTPDHNGRVLSTVVGGGWGYAQGTSMASPHAVGVVALIRSAHLSWSASRVEQALGGEADRQPCPAGVYDADGTGNWTATCQGGVSGRGFYGDGLVDALDAVTR